MQVSIALATLPSTAMIRPEPFGVALIISAWNFPISMSDNILSFPLTSLKH